MNNQPLWSKALERFFSVLAFFFDRPCINKRVERVVDWFRGNGGWGD